MPAGGVTVFAVTVRGREKSSYMARLRSSLVAS